MKEITKVEARQALLEGKKVKNIRYSDDEFLFLNSNGDLETEDGYTHGGFLSEFWNDIQAKLPNKWYVVEEKSTRELALEWWDTLTYHIKQSMVENSSLYDAKFRSPECLTGREIEEIWRKETQIPYCEKPICDNSECQTGCKELKFKEKSNQKQFKEFNPELFKSYINKFSHEGLREALTIIDRKLSKDFGDKISIEIK